MVPEGPTLKPVVMRCEPGRLAVRELDAALRTACGGHCNLDEAADVSIVAAVTVGWGEAGRLDRIGAGAEGGREACRARV
jgi:hypothetical protein